MSRRRIPTRSKRTPEEIIQCGFESCSFLCVASLAAGLVYAAPPGQIRVQVNLVNLFATVRDKHKAIVTGLKQDDFQVFEDGQAQEITNFSAESNLPITLGILIDTSGSEYYMLSGLKEAASRFLGRVLRKERPGDGHEFDRRGLCSPTSPMDRGVGWTAPSTARRSMPPAAP